MSTEVLAMEARLTNFISGEIGKIEADFKSLQSTLSNTKEKTEKVESGFKSLGAEIKNNVSRSFQDLAGKIAVIGSSAAIIGFFKKSSAAAAEDSAIQMKLANALGYVSESLNKQASSMSKTTLFMDDQISSAHAMLAMYVKTEDQIMALTPAVMDYAAAMGKDLGGAAWEVARGLAADTEQLGRTRIHVEGAAGSAERTTSAIKGLNAQFGGQAKAAADASTGIHAFENALDQLLEGAGGEINTVIRELSGSLAGLDTDFKELGRAITTGVLMPFREATAIAMSLSAALVSIGAKQGSARMNLADALMDEAVGTAKQGVGLGEKPEAAAIRKRSGGGGGFGDSKDADKTKETLAKLRDELNAVNTQVSTDMMQAGMDSMQYHTYVSNEIMTQDEKVKQQLLQSKKELADFSTKVDDAELQRAIALKQAKVSAMYQTAQQFGRTLTMMADATSANANTRKRAAQSEALINTAVSATKTATSTPYPWNIPLVGLAILQGLAQVAIIERQKFQYGGVVGGSSVSGDKVNASLNSGEMVLTREMQSSMLKMLSSPQRGGINDSRSFTLQLALPPGTPLDMRAADRIESLVPIIADALIKAEYEGRLESVKPLLKR